MLPTIKLMVFFALLAVIAAHSSAKLEALAKDVVPEMWENDRTGAVALAKQAYDLAKASMANAKKAKAIVDARNETKVGFVRPERWG